MKHKLIRITTVPLSLDKLLTGQLAFMNQHYKMIAVSSEIPYLEKIELKENVEVHHVQMPCQIPPFKGLISVYKLKREKSLIVQTGFLLATKSSNKLKIK